MSLPLSLEIVDTDIPLGNTKGALSELGAVGGITKNASRSEL